jgi:hypothetical protein
MLLYKIWTHFIAHEDEFLMEAAENISWDLAHREKIFDLENRRKAAKVLMTTCCQRSTCILFWY